VALWNTRYIDAALKALRDQGDPAADEAAAPLSPLIDAHLNVHGRYTFTEPTDDALRPLRNLTEPAEPQYLPDGTLMSLSHTSPETGHEVLLRLPVSRRLCERWPAAASML